MYVLWATERRSCIIIEKYILSLLTKESDLEMNIGTSAKPNTFDVPFKSKAQGKE